MIRFSEVSKQFDNGHKALSDVTFELAKGEMAFLTGHSGAGKSTLLKIIPKILEASKGQILINGQNIAKLTPKAIAQLRQSVGMIFQDPMLLAHRSIFDNVALPLHVAGLADADIQRRVRAALDKVSLLDKEKCYPHHLSAGEQQRVGIARAVVNRPLILLADEPTGNLDPELSSEIIALFEQFNDVGTTVLVATHDIGLIAPNRHTILALNHGYLSEGTPHV